MDITWKKAGLFYVSAIVFSWVCWIGTISLASANNVTILYNEGFYTIFMEGAESFGQLMAHIVFTATTYGPLFGVLIVKLWMKENQGFANRKTMKGSWLFFIVLYPIVLFSVALLLTQVVTGFSGAFLQPVLPFWFFAIFFIFQCLTSGMEEFGWRGYLQPLLQTKYTAEKTCYIVGILWSIWHYPFIVFISYQGGILAVVLMLAGFTLLTVPQAFVIGWLYNSTRSVWLCVIFHAWSNTVAAYLLAASPAPQLTPIIVAVIVWSFANYLVKRYSKEKLSMESV